MSFGNRFLFIEICAVRSHSYIASTTTILKKYDGAIPFAAWLKNYFREHKKFGSRDRKTVAHLCFCYYRLGNSFSGKAVEEKLLIGLFLCSSESNIMLQELKPEWNEVVEKNLTAKFQYIDAQQEWKHIFSFSNYLSDGINAEAFALSFLIQPDLFLRIRPQKKAIVLKKLSEANIDFYLVGDQCLRLLINTKIDEILRLDEEVVVQDLSSQKVLNALTTTGFQPVRIWDCCAASGGKSILAYDKWQKIQLTVSDVRESILINLRKRFEKVGIRNYSSFVADISKEDFKPPTSNFELVICDAPCSGSGTWGRTPEQLVFFKEEKIDYYASLQRKIAINASKSVKPNGYFLYITCSVFKKENEGVVSFIQNNSSLQLINATYYKGYKQKADTLFAALFKA